MRKAFWVLLVIGSVALKGYLAHSEQIPVRYMEGLLHGFLTLETLDGRTLADGELTQVAKGEQVNSHLTFRFRDGSLYDEKTEFSQHGVFRLLTDHLVEQGPSFDRPMDTLLDTASGQITVHYRDRKGKEAVISEQRSFPDDIANGLLLTLLKDIQPSVPKTTVPLVVTTPKPRLVRLEIAPEGTEAIRSGNMSRQTVRYDVKAQIPGITGVLAHLLGKQPADIHIWILAGTAPVFIKWEGPLYQGGPVWRVQVTPAEFSKRE